MPSDLLFFFGGDDLNFVGSESEKVESVSDCGTNAVAVLANAASKHEQVDAAEEGNIRPDYFADRCGEGVQRENGARIVGASAFFENLHIAFATGVGVQAAAVIDEVFHLVGTKFFRAKEIEKDAGVEIARACAHRNATGRGKAHGGVDGNAIAKRTETCSVAKVGEDGAFGQLRAEVMDEGLVREAVEPIATHAFVAVALRKRKMRSHFRHGLVKDVVKTGELRGRGKDGLGGSDKGEGLRDVHRGKMHGGAKLGEDLRRDALMGDEPRTAMDDAMAYGYRRVLNMLADCFGDYIKGMAWRLVDTCALYERFPSGRTDLQSPVAMANAVGTAGEQGFFIVSAARIEAKFQGRRAAVQNKDQIIFLRQFADHFRYSGHFQLRISSLSMPSACA